MSWTVYTRGYINYLKICESWVYFLVGREGIEPPETERPADLQSALLPITGYLPILVDVMGVEPTRIFIQRLLRPSCIPVPAHIESYNTFYIIYNTLNECQCQAFLKSYLKKRIITFEHLKLRFSGVALCQKHRKRPLVSWITRSKRP